MQQNIGSDSADDTFCRSSSSLSDDCLSHQSESNSVQWESGQFQCGKDLDLYDGLHRISMTESAAIDQGTGRRRHGEIHSGLQFPYVEYGEQNYGCSFDFQSLETQSQSFTEEPIKYANSKDIVEPQGTLTPITPPPVQWRDMKYHLDDKEDKREAFSEGTYIDFDLNFSPSTSEQPKPAPFNQYQDLGSANMQKSKQSELQASNQQRKANQLKGIDEKEDFLHQIRSKSLNLRPTVITKSKYGKPTSNVSVSAILQKANAVCQVVGNDDGEGDSIWSDT